MPRYYIESFERMKQARNLPFLKRNQRITVDGKGATVTANYGHNLWVKFDDGGQGNCHPHWRVTYFDADGGVIKEFGD